MSEILEEVVNSLSINLREMIKSISKDNHEVICNTKNKQIILIF